MWQSIIRLVCLMVSCSLMFAADFAFEGAAKCKMCHKGTSKGEVFEKWEKSLHAKAFDTLKAKGEEKNPKCLDCHVTGFNAGGYKPGDAKNSAFAGVQCEACHGAGSQYKKMSVMKDKALALKNGLVEQNEVVCKKCHNKNSPTFKGFDYAAASARISHKYRK